MYMFIIPVMSYMFTGLVRCLVDSRTSCGAHKLTRIPRIIKKKKKIKKNDTNICIESINLYMRWRTDVHVVRTFSERSKQGA
jgi:hypothetical protein